MPKVKAAGTFAALAVVMQHDIVSGRKMNPARVSSMRPVLIRPIMGRADGRKM